MEGKLVISTLVHHNNSPKRPVWRLDEEIIGGMRDSQRKLSKLNFRRK